MEAEGKSGAERCIERMDQILRDLIKAKNLLADVRVSMSKLPLVVPTDDDAIIVKMLEVPVQMAETAANTAHHYCSVHMNRIERVCAQETSTKVGG